MKRAAIITLGCPKNQVDSEVLAGALVRGGMRLVDTQEEADIIFINTCGFIEEAKRESITSILQSVQLKEENGGTEVYVWGCLAQRYRDEIEKEIPEVDGFFGVEPYEEVGRFFFGPGYRWNHKAFENRILSTPPHTAFLKIADGCDHRCTFCSIPQFKGRYRSRSLESLVDEAQVLAKRGVKEIVLVAQDTTAYGSDLKNGTCLVDLLKDLILVDGLEWIRLMYAHPVHLTDEVVNIMGQEEKICRYLDLPLQHISNGLLRDMGRGDDGEAIRKRIRILRERIPGIVLRTAFIVGFPGESESDFEELMLFIKEAQFDRMGIFIYSPEEGTEAYTLRPCIPRAVAEDRYQTLMEMQKEISGHKNRKLECKTIPVLVDGYDDAQNLFFGRSEGDAPDVDQTVWIKGSVDVGKIVPITIEASSAYDLLGYVSETGV